MVGSLGCWWEVHARFLSTIIYQLSQGGYSPPHILPKNSTSAGDFCTQDFSASNSHSFRGASGNRRGQSPSKSPAMPMPHDRARCPQQLGSVPTDFVPADLLRAFGLPRPLRYFVVSNAQDVLRKILSNLPSAGKTTLIQTRGGRKETSSRHKQTFLISYRTISRAKHHELRGAVARAQLLGVN